VIEPLLSDDAFLADVESTRGVPTLHLWWLGQSGFLLTDGFTYVLLDPYLSDSLTEKYANTDRPYVRISRRVVDPARLGFVNIVASTHAHTDHLDAGTIKPILAANPELKIVVPEANRSIAAERLGVPPGSLKGVTEGHAYITRDIAFRGVPACHDTIDRDEHGHCKYLGYHITVGPYTVYHSGDTLWYDGLDATLRNMRVDFALLPINGRGQGVAGNLTGAEAARLANHINAWVAIPCHYDMFEFNNTSPAEFVAECQRLGQRHRVLKLGERFDSREVR
jgi:L-ascorbate metabolism protein UlaG (beta-lactamase superfamily)